MHAFVHQTNLLHFPTPEVVMNNIVRRAATHVELYGNLVSSDSPVVTHSLLDLQFQLLSCHANWSPSPVFISDVLCSF